MGRVGAFLALFECVFHPLHHGSDQGRGNCEDLVLHLSGRTFGLPCHPLHEVVRHSLRRISHAEKILTERLQDVEREMHKFKRGQLKSGKGGKGGTVKSRKQAIAIGLSEAPKKGKKVPKKKAS